MPVTLHHDVFRALFAIGWIDGELRESEAHLILQAADAEDFNDEDKEAVRACATNPVDFGEVDASALDPDARLYVYALSSWIAHIDGRVSPNERAALHAVATLIGVTGLGREAMDDVIEKLQHEPFNSHALKVAIKAKADSLH